LIGFNIERKWSILLFALAQLAVSPTLATIITTAGNELSFAFTTTGQPSPAGSPRGAFVFNSSPDQPVLPRGTTVELKGYENPDFTGLFFDQIFGQNQEVILLDASPFTDWADSTGAFTIAVLTGALDTQEIFAGYGTGGQLLPANLVAVDAVPEPSTFWLLVAGLFCLTRLNSLSSLTTLYTRTTRRS
jgi:hypothetical protein